LISNVHLFLFPFLLFHFHFFFRKLEPICANLLSLLLSCEHEHDDRAGEEVGLEEQEEIHLNR